jgi:hypothetical protein
MAAGRVVGSVRNASGALVADAQISAIALGAPDGAPVEARTDRDGAFALDLTWPGEASTQVCLDVRAPGCAALAWPALSDPRAGALEPGTTLALDLVLAPGFGLRLLVEDANGQPVAGAEAEVILNNTVAHACSWPSSPWGRRSRPLTTDAEGRVEILGLVDLPYGERYFVSIRHPERAEAWIDHAEALPRDAGWASNRVVLSPGHEMRGTIQGAPEGAAVLAALRDAVVPGCHGVVRRAITDAAGHFVLTGLREGEHTVQVSGPGVLPTTTALRVPASAPIALEVPAGRVLSVRVRGEGGEPTAGAVVTAEWPGGYVEGTAGATGVVVLVLPRASRVEVSVRPEGGRGVLGFAVVEPGAVAVELAVDVSARAPWSARVVDDTTGADTSGDCSVAVRPEGAEATFHFSTCAAPHLELALPPGEYTVAVTVWGELDAQHFALVPRISVAPCAGPVRIEAVAAFACEIHVIDASSRSPVANAAVIADPPTLFGRVYMGSTDAQGRFTLDPAMEAEMRVVAEAPGYRRGALSSARIHRGMSPLVVALEPDSPVEVESSSGTVR